MKKISFLLLLTIFSFGSDSNINQNPMLEKIKDSIKQKNFGKAVEMISKISKYDIDYLKSRMLLAKIYYNQENYKKSKKIAHECITKSIDINKNIFKEANLLLSELFYKEIKNNNSDNEGAVEKIRYHALTVLSIDENNEKANDILKKLKELKVKREINLINHYLQRKEYDSALNVISRLLKDKDVPVKLKNTVEEILQKILSKFKVS